MNQYKLLDRSRDNPLTNEEIEELRGICYDKGCAVYPVDAFFNDIERNKDPRFRKDLAFKDLWLIVGGYENEKS